MVMTDFQAYMALLWFVYHLTGSALKMTAIGILETLPPLILGPFIGVYLDRISKRSAMIVIDVVRMRGTSMSWTAIRQDRTPRRAFSPMVCMALPRWWIQEPSSGQTRTGAG